MFHVEIFSWSETNAYFLDSHFATKERKFHAIVIVVWANHKNILTKFSQITLSSKKRPHLVETGQSVELILDVRHVLCQPSVLQRELQVSL